jgi:hypothetical protein
VDVLRKAFAWLFTQLLAKPEITSEIMAVESAVSCFIDLIAVVEEPAFFWGPAELRAAFQWSRTMQELLESGAAGNLVRQQLQVRCTLCPQNFLRHSRALR